jgi:FAD/FMN-containing dehydrogenase
MRVHSTGRAYLNFPGHGEDSDLVARSFGASTYNRLQQIKRRYDPHNVFRLNQNILPA